MEKNTYSGESKEKLFKLVKHELKEDPYYKFKIVFALMGVIPLLTFSYILFGILPKGGVSLSDISSIMYILIAITALAFCFGYETIRKLLNRIIFYVSEIKRSEQLKADLVASISHDFEIPIKVIREVISGVVDGNSGTLNEEQKSRLNSCQETLKNMRSTIKTLLDLYKIQAGLVSLQKENCDLLKLIEDKIAEFGSLFKGKGISLSKRGPDKGLNVMIDRDKIKEVINNLFSNFLKYIPQGGWVELRISPLSDFVRIEFINSSQFIPDDKLGAIFEKFKKVDYSTEGSGLGLAIAKDIVNLHGGNLWAENISNAVMFVLLLPVE